MRTTKELVKEWFDKWNEGDFRNLPLTADFKHTSPYGTIEGKENYLSLVEPNKDKFLGNVIERHDEVYEGDRGCVRYTIINHSFTMEVSEWLYTSNNLIHEVVAYYNIDSEISEERKVDGYD